MVSICPASPTISQPLCRPAGRPAQLTRTTNQQVITQNRQASCGGVYAQTVTQLNQLAGGTVLSCDEYAFASTVQGGAGNQSMIVPLIENNSQGGILSGFYTQNNIGDGTNFNVALTNIPQANQLNLAVVNGVNVCYGGN
ncbi:NucA/NucB deoxyribonuclease domain-containing protein [Ancylobacter sp. IITR112]|uniref:NucA/NucB deoxyribonuclease domain-containing protein n=1 Tax=Ancylobacter sp. IITR112 TaxID=3138073 RepID=UPI00352A81E4